MPWQLRVLLIVGSLWMMYYVLRRIRKSKMRTEDSIFWLFFSFILVVIGIFPDIASFFSKILGVQSPANLVFSATIFLLLIKLFLLDRKVSMLQHKLMHFIQKYAIDEEKKETNGIQPANNDKEKENEK